MNTLCAAGTGSFLSSQAHRLGVEVEDFGPIALTSKHPANIAARCTVFAERRPCTQNSSGLCTRRCYKPGSAKAVATNYLNNVGEGKRILSPIVFKVA